jgi:CRISPR-associated endonuclease Csn1
VRAILQQRLDEYDGDAAKAFSNLDDNPIWLNKEKGIAIKRVKIRGIANGEAIRVKRDNKGAIIKDENGNPIPNDFVNTGNNHHVAVFRDANGKLQEHVVSFYEAATRATLGYPIVDKNYNRSEGWEFLFSMKQNEYFVFPNEKTGFNPQNINLLDANNWRQISPNLYRVQKFTTGDYVFRHHLETNVESENALRDITWKRIRAIQNLDGIIKVRLNHLGNIVAVGEY